MNRPGLAAAALALALVSAATPVIAVPCAGFTDVQTTDTFCNAVQWLKNRQITTGCGAGTTYCPSDAVTRASMALFMNRLGLAVSPKMLAVQGVTGAATLTPNNFSAVCSTAVVPAVNYPQAVRAHGTISVPAVGNQLALSFYLSENGGPFQNMSSTQLLVGPVNGVQNLSWNSSAFTITPGNTLSFAVAIVNPVGSGGNLVLQAGLCSLHADVWNFNGATAPFDE